MPYQNRIKTKKDHKNTSIGSRLNPMNHKTYKTTSDYIRIYRN